MSEPLPEQVLQWIAEGLAEIRQAAGYHTDLGLGFITTEPAQVPESASAHTVVTETEITRNAESSGPRTLASDMSIVVEFIVPRTDSAPARLARRGRDDITRVLHRSLRTAPKGLRALVVEGTARLITDDERRSNYIIAQVTARAGLSESFSPATIP